MNTLIRILFFWRWFSTPAETPTPKTPRAILRNRILATRRARVRPAKRKTKPGARHRRGRFANKLIRRVLRFHGNGLQGRRGRKRYAYRMIEEFANSTIGWRRKNKIRRKTKKKPQRWFAYWRHNRKLTPVASCSRTRTERKARERADARRSRRQEKARMHRGRLARKPRPIAPICDEFLPQGVNE